MLDPTRPTLIWVVWPYLSWFGKIAVHSADCARCLRSFLSHHYRFTSPEKWSGEQWQQHWRPKDPLWASRAIQQGKQVDYHGLLSMVGEISRSNS